MKNIDADYYGYRDEDDGVIVPLEAELEEKCKIISCFTGVSSAGTLLDTSQKKPNRFH